MENVHISLLLTTIIYILLYINLPSMHGDDFKEIDESKEDDTWVD